MIEFFFTSATAIQFFEDSEILRLLRNRIPKAKKVLKKREIAPEEQTAKEIFVFASRFPHKSSHMIALPSSTAVLKGRLVIAGVSRTYCWDEFTWLEILALFVWGFPCRFQNIFGKIDTCLRIELMYFGGSSRATCKKETEFSHELHEYFLSICSTRNQSIIASLSEGTPCWSHQEDSMMLLFFQSIMVQLFFCIVFWEQ